MQWNRRGERQGTREHKCQKKDKQVLAVCNTLRGKNHREATSSIQHLEQEPFTSQELTKSFKL